jgi:ATP-dependent Lon protease
MWYDLSKVMFIATSNNMARHSTCFADRMEIIKCQIEEKEIARQHLFQDN